MLKKYHSSTLSKLILLVSIFFIGIFSLIIIHLFFLDLMEKLDNKTKNQKAKIQIGEYIVNDLYKIRSDFYELATTATNKKGRELIARRLEERINDIKEALHILENGGTLKRVIRLNIAGHNHTTKIINYKKDNNESFSLEAIDLRPKLEQLLQMTEHLQNLLDIASEYRNNNDHKKFTEFIRNITRYYKSTPAFFIRITENTRRLLYEGENTLATLEYTIQQEKQQYQRLEILLIIVIILLVLILAYIIGTQINKNSKDLIKLNNELQKKMLQLKIQEEATRGILDGQPNMVVVSNGTEMIDANSALIDFFDGYHSFNDFKEEHACICDFFQKMNDDDFLENKDYDGLRWYEYIIENPNKMHKVAMKNLSGLHFFTITAKRKVLEKENFIIIISLNDITNEISVQKELEQLNDNLENIIDYKTKELQELNENLEKKVQKEVEKNRQKDKRMIQQSRFAALGEMIGNIAHQWRQPLSAISSTASSMQLQLQLKLTNEEEIEKSYKTIISYVEFLTHTIEDFRNFFKEDKQKVEYEILEVLKKTLNITDAAYKDRNIQVILNKKQEYFKSFGFPNELSQVFLNILNNAKDAITNNKINYPIVQINIYEEENLNIIEILDNAGGINQEIIDKIFDPYFTTKHQSQGTGIGLYMSKEIIEKHMNGILKVENRTLIEKDNKQQGACFIISLPKI
ncbi:HAMP domain-containing sensor histidine kinase [Malaciobacter mytili]|uniref:sensor histidine kinase n=1 Tax=Malaciobacter mytili TaxID=603050 RepID=UPI003BB046B5